MKSKPKILKGDKTAKVSILQCPHCEYKTEKPQALRMHTYKKHPAAKEAEDIKAAIAGAEEKMVYPETSPSVSTPIQPPSPSIMPSEPESISTFAEREAADIKASINAAEANMAYPESVSETEPEIADIINSQATEQDALINLARYIRDKGTTSMKKEVLLSLGVPANAIPEAGGIMFKNRYLIRRVTQGHDLLSVEQP